MRLPRLTTRRLMELVAVAAAILALLNSHLTVAVPRRPAVVPLTFRVVDVDMGRPIAAARIRVGTASTGPLPPIEASTAIDGSARVAFPTDVVIHKTAIRRVSRAVGYVVGLSVDAERYGPVRHLLSDHARGHRYHEDRAPPPIVIQLRKETATRPMSPGASDPPRPK